MFVKHNKERTWWELSFVSQDWVTHPSKTCLTAYIKEKGIEVQKTHRLHCLMKGVEFLPMHFRKILFIKIAKKSIPVCHPKLVIINYCSGKKIIFKISQSKVIFIFLMKSQCIFFLLRKISPELITANPPLFAEEDWPWANIYAHLPLLYTWDAYHSMSCCACLACLPSGVMSTPRIRPGEPQAAKKPNVWT